MAAGHITPETLLVGQQTKTIYGFIPCSLQSKASLLAWNAACASLCSSTSICNPAIEHNVPAFSELYVAVRWQGRLSGSRLVLRVTALIQVVNYSSDSGQSCWKGWRVSTKSGPLSILFAYNWDCENCMCVIRSSGVSAIQGCLGIEVNGMTIGTFRIVHCTKECDKTAILPIRALCIVIITLIR